MPHSSMPSPPRLQVCGDAEVEGDFIVPVAAAHLEGAAQINLQGAFHSPLGAKLAFLGPWYGSPEVRGVGSVGHGWAGARVLGVCLYGQGHVLGRVRNRLAFVDDAVMLGKVGTAHVRSGSARASGRLVSVRGRRMHGPQVAFHWGQEASAC